MTTFHIGPNDPGTRDLAIDNTKPGQAQAVTPTAPTGAIGRARHQYISRKKLRYMEHRPPLERRGERRQHSERRKFERRRKNLPVILNTRSPHDRRHASRRDHELPTRSGTDHVV